jgi:hypothetical protein
MKTTDDYIAAFEGKSAQPQAKMPPSPQTTPPTQSQPAEKEQHFPNMVEFYADYWQNDRFVEDYYRNGRLYKKGIFTDAELKIYKSMRKAINGGYNPSGYTGELFEVWKKYKSKKYDAEIDMQAEKTRRDIFIDLNRMIPEASFLGKQKSEAKIGLEHDAWERDNMGRINGVSIKRHPDLFPILLPKSQQ